MAIAFLVIGLILALGGLGGTIYTSRSAIRNGEAAVSRRELLFIMGSIGVASVGTGFLSAATNTWGSWNMGSGDAAMAVSGIALCVFFLLVLWVSFAFYYYKSGFDAKQKKMARIAMFAAIPFVFAFFLLFGEGVAPYLDYPLVNGIVFGGDAGFYFSTPETGNTGGVHIMWYAVFILSGVAVCYFISDHEFYKRYGRHGILEVLVVVAFLCGIIGARVWYVVGNWTLKGFDKDFSKVFAIWDGGLTIIGGAVFGIVGGVCFIAFNKKYRFVEIPWGMGIIVPTILLAQGIGRWGNFFNCEVHGVAVALSDGWQWLPTWLWRNMQYSSMGPSLAGTDQIYVPLFLIESMINIAGYFIIRYGICYPLRKWIADGDAAGLYFIYYGVTRIIMEPLRYQAYNMGEDGNFSIWGSLAFIIIGVLLIAFFELWRLFAKHFKERKPAVPSGDVIEAHFAEAESAIEGGEKKAIEETSEEPESIGDKAGESGKQEAEKEPVELKVTKDGKIEN